MLKCLFHVCQPYAIEIKILESSGFCKCTYYSTEQHREHVRFSFYVKGNVFEQRFLLLPIFINQVKQVAM